MPVRVLIQQVVSLLTFVSITFDRNSVRNVGEPTFWYIKVIMGLGIFLLLMLLLFLPLFLFMQGTSSSVPNLAIEADVFMGFSGTIISSSILDCLLLTEL